MMARQKGEWQKAISGEGGSGVLGAPEALREQRPVD